MTPLQTAVLIAILAAVNLGALYWRVRDLRRSRRATVVSLERYRVLKGR